MSQLETDQMVEIPAHIMNDLAFIYDLARIENMEQFCELIAVKYGTHFLMTNSQLEKVLKKFEKVLTNGNILRKVGKELWENSEMLSLMIISEDLTTKEVKSEINKTMIKIYGQLKMENVKMEQFVKKEKMEKIRSKQRQAIEEFCEKHELEV